MGVGGLGNYPGQMEIWNPSEDWHSRHKSQDLAYEVRLRLCPSSITDQIWNRLRSTRQGDEDTILDGGAYLRRVGPDEIEIGSGGQDGLDSLESCVNNTFGETVGVVAPTATVHVVRETRIVLNTDDLDNA